MANEENEELLKSVSDAIAEVTPAAAKTKPDDEPAPKPANAPADAVDEKPDDKPDDEPTETPDGDSKETAADDESDDELDDTPDDKPDDKLDDKPDDAPKGDQEVARLDKPTAEKKADVVNDPIPEGIKKETGERMSKLITLVKEQTAAVQERDEFLQAITATGTNPEQYTQTLDFLRLFNSTKREDRIAALKQIQEAGAMLAIALGEELPGMDVLSQFPDLKADVEAGDMPEARAKEIALARLQKKQNQETAERLETARTSQLQTDRLVQEGKAQLTKFETAIMADPVRAPTYTALRASFIKVLRPVLRETHASKWGEVAQELFNTLAENFSPPAAAPVAAPRQQPLRHTRAAGGGGGSQKEAKSALEAINSALDEL